MDRHTIRSLIEEIKDDVIVFLKAKQEALQLKATDKVAKATAKATVGAVLTLVFLLTTITLLIVLLFAFSLLFVRSIIAYEVIAPICYASLSILTLLLITFIIIFLMKRKIEGYIEEQMINKVLQQMDEKERRESTLENDLESQNKEVPIETSPQTPITPSQENRLRDI